MSLIYVDPLMNHGMMYYSHRVDSCHLFTDGDPAGLHAFALALGCRRAWFHNGRVPHYDLTESKRLLAVSRGAIELDHDQAAEMLRALGGQTHDG